MMPEDLSEFSLADSDYLEYSARDYGIEMLDLVAGTRTEILVVGNATGITEG